MNGTITGKVVGEELGVWWQKKGDKDITWDLDITTLKVKSDLGDSWVRLTVDECRDLKIGVGSEVQIHVCKVEKDDTNN